MSAPNHSYDPVEVTPLHPDEVARMRDEALEAIAKASTLEELKKSGSPTPGTAPRWP